MCGTFPKRSQTALRNVRSAVKKAAPQAKETISYNLPEFSLNGKMLVWFRGIQIPHWILSRRRGYCKRLGSISVGSCIAVTPYRAHRQIQSARVYVTLRRSRSFTRTCAMRRARVSGFFGILDPEHVLFAMREGEAVEDLALGGGHRSAKIGGNGDGALLPVFLDRDE